MTDTAPQTQDTQTEHLAQFADAVRKRDVRWMRAILENGLASVPSELGGEALLHASGLGAIETVELLLRAGVDPNSRDGIGETALYRAVEGNHPEVARALLAAGANPNGTPDVPDAAPILCAVERDHLMMLEILTEAGAARDVTFPNSIGDTLLHKAVDRGFLDIVKYLVKTGMPIDVGNDWGDTPLHKAVSQNSHMIAPLLELGANVNAQKGNGGTPLFSAAFSGWPQAFELLVAAGGDPLALENHELNVFDTALRGRRPAMAAWLLERYPSLAPAGEELDKAFVIAVRSGCAPLIKQLAALGADLGQKPDGRTLLQIAPAKAVEAKRVLRALKTGASIEQAMGGDDEPPAPAAPSMTL